MADDEPSITPSMAEILTEIDAKRVSAHQHPDDNYLWIFNYTPKVQFDKLWNPVNMACRGLILRIDGPLRDPNTKITEVVALPWAKFFNVSEDGKWPTSPVVSVTEKMDGSLGILYRIKGHYAIATRGSFVSEQAIWATAHLQFLMSEMFLSFDALPNSVTLLFEIICKESHVVVDYDYEDLVVIGARDRFTGWDWGYQELDNLSDCLVLNCVEAEDFHESDVSALYDKRHFLEIDREGWVVLCEDGSRWKIKGDEYRRWHNLLSRLSERYVIDCIADDTIDELIEHVPAPYVKRVTTWRDNVLQALDIATDYTAGVFVRGPVDGTRKDFALWVLENYPKDSGFLFSMYDNKSIVPQLLKVIREEASYEPLISGVE